MNGILVKIKKQRFFYREPLIPVLDYFLTLKLDEFLYDLFFPMACAIGIYFIVLKDMVIGGMFDFIGTLVAILTILIGFSITSLSVIASNGSQNIIDLKQTSSERKIIGQEISLYQLLIITNTYSIIIEIVSLLFNLAFLFICKAKLPHFPFSIYYSVNIFLLMHVFLLILRNSTNIYHVFFRNR